MSSPAIAERNMKESWSLGFIRPYLPLTVLCFMVFAFYQMLIYYNPAIYWFDSHIRLALHDQVLVGHWLPLFQALIVLFSKFNLNLIALRSIFSLLSVGSLIALYFLGNQLFSQTVGLIAVVFLSLNTMFAALATVFYPDVLFVGLSLITLYFLDQSSSRRYFYFGVIALNLACLTRYEGWLLSALFVGESMLRSFRTLHWKVASQQVIKIIVLCSLTPLAWIAFGFPESGGLLERLKAIAAFESLTTTSLLSNHIFTRLNLAYLGEFSRDYFHILKWQIHPEFILMGGAGFLLALMNSPMRLTHWRILIFLILDFFLWAISQQRSFGNLRQPFLLQAFLILYASHGLVEGMSWLYRRLYPLAKNANAIDWIMRLSIVATIILSVRLIPSTTKFITVSSRETDFFIPYGIGTWLAPRLEKEDAILILDDTDFYAYALAAYLHYPLEKILDDRLDTHLVQENLDSAQMVYVIELYKLRSGLSITESRLLEDLENGHIQAERFIFGTANVWYAPANQLIYSP